jgi:hypothetical protein
VAEVLEGVPSLTPVFARTTKSCAESADMTGKATCFPATWSPDGTKLLAPDIAGAGILIAPADGTGTPFMIRLQTARGFDIHPAWQPLR